ncbi:MAG: hypothetical protein CMM04_16680 [Rhodopirellula sp.]|nr:hypothetical protein [Rhodopirellula sp.]|tara:strand:+ start:6758 stop:6943 length:186 start_codon:yes stop_codon:yes gene_type:complete
MKENKYRKIADALNVLIESKFITIDEVQGMVAYYIDINQIVGDVNSYSLYNYKNMKKERGV